MSIRMLRAFVTGAILGTVLAGLPARAADEANAATSQQITLTAAAALLLEANRIDEAKGVVALALQQNPNDNEAIFLRGLIAIAQQNYDAAIDDFRRILAAEPERERVRLELARAFFLQGDYENAGRNFRFARAGDLPDEAKANVDQYLAAITRLKRWSYNLSLGVADDTNVNGGSNLRTVYLYGLPFTLSDTARQTSGIGAAIDVSGEFSPLLSETSKFLAGGLVHRLQYGRGQFDDMTVSLYSGPQFFFGRWRVDVLTTGFGRWYGEAPYAGGAGGRSSIGYALTPTVQAGLNVEGQSVWYRPVHDQNGPIYAASAELAYTITPSSIVRFSGGVAAQQAQLSAYANDTYWATVDYYQDLPFGFSANLEPAYSSVGFHAPLSAFGATRADHVWAVRLDLLNRRLEYRGFAPRISFIHAHLDSTIALYRYTRDQVQFGVTRQF